ncbi:MAG: hypothetical protein HZA78_10800 [Candidatus Schekmanbacteria bacterium]|nr:hypothetical protein [Candidatus Schekmanbacteria bacterium]
MPKNIRMCSLILGLLFFLAVPRRLNAELLEYISSGDNYLYTFATPEAGWQNPNFDDSHWEIGDAPFSNISSPAGEDFNYGVYWPSNSVLYLRTSFDMGTPTDMTASIKIDNRFDMWINGTYIWGAKSDRFTWTWQYIFTIGAEVFRPGRNVIAIKLEDYGDLTAFDMTLSPAGGPTDISLRMDRGKK